MWWRRNSCGAANRRGGPRRGLTPMAKIFGPTPPYNGPVELRPTRNALPPRVPDGRIADPGRTARTAPTLALALTKRALDESWEKLDLERELQRRAGLTGDCAEGVRAFNGE